MNGFKKALLLVTLLLGCSALGPNRHEIISHAQAQTVYITADVTTSIIGKGIVQSEVNAPICGGFLYKELHGQEVIITAAHCLQPDKQQVSIFGVINTFQTIKEVHFIDGDVAQVQDTYVSTKDDVGLILAHSIRNHNITPSFGYNALTGDPLFVMGMPSGHLWLYSSAIVSNNEVLAQDVPQPWTNNTIYMECVSCWPGDSGSPVFDATGNIVGIVNATTDTDNLFLITPSAIVKQVADEAVKELPTNLKL